MNDVLPDGWKAGYAVTLTNGVVLSRALTRDTYRRGLIVTITYSVDGVGVTPLIYEYDYLGRVTNRNGDAFGYNARSEVTAANIASNEYGYAYDDTGNHLVNTVNTFTNSYVVNALNQYTNINHFAGSIQPVYDLDGNMVSNGVWTFTYDAENRMTAAYSNSVCIVSNVYDHASRRVLMVTAIATHTFAYDGWNLIQVIISDASGVATNHYVWGKDLSGTMQGAGGVGGLLAVSRNGAWHFPFYDDNLRVASSRGIVGAMRERFPTRAD